MLQPMAKTGKDSEYSVIEKSQKETQWETYWKQQTSTNKCLKSVAVSIKKNSFAVLS